MSGEKKTSGQNQPNKRPSLTGSSIWKYLIGFTIFWLALSYAFNVFSEQSRINISYSTFKTQIKEKNVKEVTIKGKSVKGTFRKNHPYTPPSSKDTTRYKTFATDLPSYSDPELSTILDTSNVTVFAKQESSDWLTYIILMFLPWILIIAYFVYARKKMQGKAGGMGGIFGIGKSRAKRFKKEMTTVRFNDVAGLDNPKKDLMEIIDFLREPGKFTSLGAQIPKGILLVGPPGTGKTLLARATAGEANSPFFSTSGSEFIEMFVGVGASRVRDLFDNAKKNAPSIIFIDEIDSIGRARGTGLGGGHDEREQTLNQILSEMDGFEPNQSVVIIAATNRPDILDPALTRPGRFDRRIYLELPQKNARLKILEIHTRAVPLAKDVNLENIAARTVSFSGADLKNLINEAALLAGRKKKNKVDTIDLDEARDKILLGDEREEKMSDEEKEIVAYHEAGHALLAKLLPNTDPLQKVTIIPRGRTLGATEQIPESDRYNFKKQYLLDRICVTLGGRASEELIFNEITNGAASDLKVVTNIARKMVCQWGMSDKVGPVMFRHGEEHPFLGREIAQQKDFSESTAKIIDEEIQKIVKDMEHKAIRILKENKIKLKAIAEALLENETLENKQVDWILSKVSSGRDKKEREKKAEEQEV
jgi:cell division protease FtsH